MEENFASYRLNEVLGAWQPYVDVIAMLERIAQAVENQIQSKRSAELLRGCTYMGATLGCGGRSFKIADSKIPLVILSNAANDQISTMLTSSARISPCPPLPKQAQAYNRASRLLNMFDVRSVRANSMFSSSFRYDHMSAAISASSARV